MDHCAISVGAFHKLADGYRDKYMDLTMYDDSSREFCERLRPGRARVLDAACGPGNVSRYLMGQRPDLDLLGIDLAPRMVELAREAVLSAQFVVHDCRHVADLQRRFDGIICAFGLPYLSGEEAAAFIRAAGHALDPGGVLYFSTMLGKSEDSGFESCSTGDQVYVNYHGEDQVMSWLQGCGLTLLTQSRLPSPSAAVKATTDLIVIAQTK
jgi:2-polyprenyl-3-methyl-5-hydroxy-6-metoxy-1,4-benzoquinol methylase